MKFSHGLAMGALACAAGTALAGVRVDLYVFENSDGVDTSTVDLWVDVIDQGSSIDFTFHNDSTTGVVTAVYCEVNNLIANGTILGSSGAVSFAPSATPHTPPGSIFGYGGTWEGNLYSADADAPGPANGVGVGETLTVRFDLLGSFADVIDALRPNNADGFRIAQHAQSFGPSSLWTVNTPAPGAACLLGLAGALIARRRR